jgi:hypothetical protein
MRTSDTGKDSKLTGISILAPRRGGGGGTNLRTQLGTAKPTCRRRGANH